MNQCKQFTFIKHLRFKMLIIFFSFVIFFNEAVDSATNFDFNIFELHHLAGKKLYPVCGKTLYFSSYHGTSYPGFTVYQILMLKLFLQICDINKNDN